jgi:hypothetical protein
VEVQHMSLIRRTSPFGDMPALREAMDLLSLSILRAEPARELAAAH